MVLLNDIMVSEDCSEFSGFMNSIYYDHKRKNRVSNHPEYLRLAEAEYRTRYYKQKWTAPKNDPTSDFFVDDRSDQGERGSGRGSNKKGGRGGRGGHGNSNDRRVKLA